MNIAFSDLFGKKLALLIWYKNEAGERTAGIVNGTGFLHDGNLALHRGNLVAPMQIPLKLVWRAKVVPQELKDILKMAEYCIEASVQELGLLTEKEENWSF